MLEVSPFLVVFAPSLSYELYKNAAFQGDKGRGSPGGSSSTIQYTNHGIYIRWYLKKRCARKERSLLCDLYKDFDSSSAGTNQVFLPETTYFPSCVRNI